jgi:hypothetical protein
MNRQCARTKITKCAHHYWHKLSETALLLTEQEVKSCGEIIRIILLNII